MLLSLSLKYRITGLPPIPTKELSDNEIANLYDYLCGRTKKELCLLAKSVSVRLIVSSCKTDVVDRLITMAWIGTIRDEAIDGDTDGDITEISYIINEVKES